jgi:sec-independent protein translocase protein TatA
MNAFLQGNELLIVAVVIMVLFGGSQLPKLARNLGSAQKEFKKAMDEGKSGQSSDDSSNS